MGRSKNKTNPNSGSFIGRMRKGRAMQTIFMDFYSGPVPTKPQDLAVRNLKVRFVQQDDIDTIQKVCRAIFLCNSSNYLSMWDFFDSQLFQERPIWTKAALSHIAPSVHGSSLKLILAVTAFIFKNGPWRNSWVRIGYDPRTDPLAR